MTVLIIDDEPLVRRSLQKAMKSRGHTIFEAEDGKAGLKMWQKHLPELVFLDILMPGLSGPEVLNSIDTNIRSSTKVVLISAYSGSHDVKEALNLGADLYIRKPFDDIFRVVETVEKLVGK